MLTACIGLSNPGGTIDHFGVNATGALAETDLIDPVTVPNGDIHHLTDLHIGVQKGSVGTRFMFYSRSSASASWVQREEIPVGDYGSHTITFGTSLEVHSGHQWKATFLQTTIGRCSVRVGGQAQFADSKNW